MKTAVKAIILILLASLISGCSNKEAIRAKECEALTIERLNWENQAAEFESETRWAGSHIFYIETKLKAWDTYKQSMWIVLDNPDCFPTYVYQAETFIEENLGEAYRKYIKAYWNNPSSVEGKGVEDFK